MMKLLNQKVWSYLFPPVDADTLLSIDRQSMHSIHDISLAACVLETLGILVFMTVDNWKFEGSSLASFYSMGFCALFSLIVFFFSRRMLKNRGLAHWHYTVFKTVFFVVFSLWAIHADIRHYAAGDQMLTFITFQLLAACFILFEPLLSILLEAAAYAVFYIAAWSARRADGIDIYNFVLLAVLSAVVMCVRYETQFYLARKEAHLEEASHRDALTGLRNRLALEEDVSGLYGEAVSAYMIDIDYFKEFNDRYGHAIGDEILRKTGGILEQLYPDALRYRYGGDEFLVLSRGDGARDYPGAEYSFKEESPRGVLPISLSIGGVQGIPASYDEVFSLISRADAALYETKAKTHSPEHGGHDRRQRR